MAERTHWWTERWLRSTLFLSLSLTTYLPYLPTDRPTYLSIYVSIYLSIDLSIYLSVYLYIYISLSNLITYLFIYLPIYLFIYLSLSLCLSVCLPVCLSICLSASLKTKLFCETSSMFEVDNIKNAEILRDFLHFWTWQRQKKQSNFARLPQCSKLTTSKTKKFCKTSSMFEVDNVKNEEILQDILNFWTWQRQKRSNSATLPHFSKLTTSKTKQFLQKWKVKCRAFCDFSSPCV